MKISPFSNRLKEIIDLLKLSFWALGITFAVGGSVSLMNSRIDANASSINDLKVLYASDHDMLIRISQEVHDIHAALGLTNHRQ